MDNLSVGDVCFNKIDANIGCFDIVYINDTCNTFSNCFTHKIRFQGCDMQWRIYDMLDSWAPSNVCEGRPVIYNGQPEMLCRGYPGDGYVLYLGHIPIYSGCSAFWTDYTDKNYYEIMTYC